MKKKILILANCGDGIYLFRMELIKALLPQYDVLVAIPFDNRMEEIRASGCELIETPMERRGMNPLKDIKLYREYRKIMRKVKPDMVITYTIKPNIYGGYAARRAHIPYAANITGLGTAFEHGGMLTTLVKYMNRTALKKAKVVFFENTDNRDIFVRMGIVPADHTHVLHGAGVNLSRFYYADYPADTDTTRFLFSGRVMQEKGITELFGAMKRLRADGCRCELHILGSYEENYKAQIEGMESEGWLHYHGFQSDVRPFIADCHCFILPSYHEGMANVNLECAAMGRPVITTRIHGCMEAVIEGQSGLLCEKADEDSLYTAMKRFLSISREERVLMGRTGRAHMEDEFDKQKVVAETVEALGL